MAQTQPLLAGAAPTAAPPAAVEQPPITEIRHRAPEQQQSAEVRQILTTADGEDDKKTTGAWKLPGAVVAPRLDQIYPLVPAALGTLWLVVTSVIPIDADGMLSVSGQLAGPMPIHDLANYWYIALSGFAVMMSLMLHNVLYRTRWLARGVFAELAVDAASFGAAEHDLLVRKGSVVTRHDVAESVIVFGCGVYVAYEVTFTYHIFEFGGRNDLPAKPWYSLTAWWVTIFVVIMGVTMLLYAYFLRASILKREGANSLVYLEGAIARTRVGVLVSLGAAWFVAICVLNAPPYAPSLYRANAPNPCTDGADTAWLSAHCNASTAPYAAPGALECVAPPYEEYANAHAACEAQRSSFDTSARAAAAWGLIIDVLMWIYYDDLVRGQELARLRFPLVNLLGRFTVVGFMLLAVPLYLGVMLAPHTLRRTWLASAVADLFVFFANMLVVPSAFIVMNIEEFLARFDALRSGSHMESTLPNGKRVNVRDELTRLVEEHASSTEPPHSPRRRGGGSSGGGRQAAPTSRWTFRSAVKHAQGAAKQETDPEAADAADGPATAYSKFSGEPGELRCGKPTETALGINHVMRVDPLHFAMPPYAEGVMHIAAEIEASGTASDRECLDYVLRRRAGSSDLTFSNGGLKRDCDAAGRLLPSRQCADGQGMLLPDFVALPASRVARLQEAHVLALRLYTTAAFASLNTPLRDTSEARPPHPFPKTINFIKEAILQLRAAGDTGGSGAADAQDLWRGMKNLRAADDFLRRGGTELAPMSTTTSLAVAVQYSLSPSSLLFKISTKSFLQRGAELTFLSAFPAEAEVLLPPLTYLRPTGQKLELIIGDLRYTVIEVEPTQ